MHAIFSDFFHRENINFNFGVLKEAIADIEIVIAFAHTQRAKVNLFQELYFCKELEEKVKIKKNIMEELRRKEVSLEAELI